MHTEIFLLSQLPVGCCSTIAAVDADGQEKERLTDLGFAPPLKVKALFRSPARDPTAYEVMGAVLALRSEDASKIKIRKW